MSLPSPRPFPYMQVSLALLAIGLGLPLSVFLTIAPGQTWGLAVVAATLALASAMLVAKTQAAALAATNRAIAGAEGRWLVGILACLVGGIGWLTWTLAAAG